MQNFRCSTHLHTWAKVFNNWYPPERYFYASSSLSDDIFGPSLGNSTFVSVVTWECWGKQQRIFRESRVVMGRHASHYFLVSQIIPRFLISFSLFKLLSYHKSQYFKLKCEPHFNINLVIFGLHKELACWLSPQEYHTLCAVEKPVSKMIPLQTTEMRENKHPTFCL